MPRQASTRLVIVCTALFCGGWAASIAAAQQGTAANSGDVQPGLYVNDQTGYVYRKVYRTMERPTTETRMEQRTETVYTPQVVTTTRPEQRTVYSPVVRYEWEPRWHGWWNPFTQPTLAYHAVPRARWESRSESVDRTERRTEWIAEHRTREVPTRVSRIDRQTVTDYEVVGRLNGASGGTALADNNASGASLRPLRSDEQMIGLNDSGVRPRFGSSDIQIASARPLHSVTTVTPTSPRTRHQTGIEPTVLSGSVPTLAPIYGGSTIATAPVMSRWR